MEFHYQLRARVHGLLCLFFSDSGPALSVRCSAQGSGGLYSVNFTDLPGIPIRYGSSQPVQHSQQGRGGCFRLSLQLQQPFMPASRLATIVELAAFAPPIPYPRQSRHLAPETACSPVGHRNTAAAVERPAGGQRRRFRFAGRAPWHGGRSSGRPCTNGGHRQRRADCWAAAPVLPGNRGLG